jgi:hypothetical protein
MLLCLVWNVVEMLVMWMRGSARVHWISRALQQTFKFRAQAPSTYKVARRSQPKISARRSSVEANAMPSKGEVVPTLSLCGVALLWATFGPCLRVIYAVEGVLLICLLYL